MASRKGDHAGRALPNRRTGRATSCRKEVLLMSDVLSGVFLVLVALTALLKVLLNKQPR